VRSVVNNTLIFHSDSEPQN